MKLTSAQTQILMSSVKAIECGNVSYRVMVAFTHNHEVLEALGFIRVLAFDGAYRWRATPQGVAWLKAPLKCSKARARIV